MPVARTAWALCTVVVFAGSAAAAEPDTLTGILRRVAVTEREIIVARPGDGGKETYKKVDVTADTTISRDGKAVALADLQPEVPVTVRTQQRDGHLVAVSIQVGAGGPVVAPAADMPGSRIAKVRRVLRLVDQILERVEERTNAPRPPPPPPQP